MKYLVPTLIILVIVLTAALGFFILKNHKLLNTPKLSSAPIIADIVEEATSQTNQQASPKASPTPTLVAVQNVIKTAVAAKNYEALIPYMAKTVNFTIMSSDCCQPQTPQGAAEQLSYIDEGVPFDFNQKTEVVNNIKFKKPTLKNAYIGISTVGEQLAAFIIVNNKIATIELAISYKLYDL